MSMEKMNEVVVSMDRKTVAVGPGNRWVDVYSTLEPEELAVVGGRVCFHSSKEGACILT